MNRLFLSQKLRPLQCLPGIRMMSQSNCPVTSSQREIKTFEEIPGPRVLPVIGTLFDALFHKKGALTAILYLPQERVKQFGNIYYEQPSSSSIKHIHIFDLKDIESVFRNEQSFPRRRDDLHPVLKQFWERPHRKPSIFFANGPEWYKYRSAVSKLLLLPRAMAQHIPEMNSIASEMITTIKTLRNTTSAEIGEVKDLDTELLKWSFESLAYAILQKRLHSTSGRPDPLVEEYLEAITQFFKVMGPALSIPPQIASHYKTKAHKAFHRHFDKMYDLAEYFITERVKELKDEGRLSASSASLNADDTGEVSLFEYLLNERGFTEKELVYCTMDLIIAGVDTVFNTMQWILYELAKNQDKQAILYNEILNSTPSTTSGQNVLTKDQLSHQLPYQRAVIKETLRLHPILPVHQRILQKDAVMSGYKVPAGSQLALLTYATSRDPNVFQDAEKFLPERWLRSNNAEKINQFATLPFGHGRRMCVGRRLAELELHVLLYHIMVNFHLEYPEDAVLLGTPKPERPVQVKFVDRV